MIKVGEFYRTYETIMEIISVQNAGFTVKYLNGRPGGKTAFYYNWMSPGELVPELSFLREFLS